jgi:hypothetical protein
MLIPLPGWLVPAPRSSRRSTRMLRVPVVFMALLWLTGCAGLAVKTIGANPERDSKVKGFRYYQASPYLLVATDNKGGLTSDILYLPDTMKKMSVRPFAVGANNESTLTFEGGVLKQAAATVDETVIPKVTLDALKDVLAVAAKGAFNVLAEDKPTVPAPSLFKIFVSEGTIILVGGQGDPKVIKTGVKP